MRRQGFTLVEVMVSLGVMTIGAMALIGMQQQATRANVRARDITVATQIAQNVIERLKMDAAAWVSVTPDTNDALVNTQILRLIPAVPTGVFLTLPPMISTLIGTTKTLTNAFDFAGQDIDLSVGAGASAGQVRFCASHRLSWVFTNRRAMRADVRVWWSKETPTRTITNDFPACADDGATLNPGTGGTFFDSYHIVYLSTVLRPTGT